MSQNRLYIGNLPHESNSTEIEEAFSKYGTVSQVEFKDGKGYSYLVFSRLIQEYENSSDCSKAIEAMDG